MGQITQSALLTREYYVVPIGPGPNRNKRESELPACPRRTVLSLLAVPIANQLTFCVYSSPSSHRLLVPHSTFFSVTKSVKRYSH